MKTPEEWASTWHNYVRSGIGDVYTLTRSFLAYGNERFNEGLEAAAETCLGQIDRCREQGGSPQCHGVDADAIRSLKEEE